jgi:hypothetical protein
VIYSLLSHQKGQQRNGDQTGRNTVGMRRGTRWLWWSLNFFPKEKQKKPKKSKKGELNYHNTQKI